MELGVTLAARARDLERRRPPQLAHGSDTVARESGHSHHDPFGIAWRPIQDVERSLVSDRDVHQISEDVVARVSVASKALRRVRPHLNYGAVSELHEPSNGRPADNLHFQIVQSPSLA